MGKTYGRYCVYKDIKMENSHVGRCPMSHVIRHYKLKQRHTLQANERSQDSKWWWGYRDPCYSWLWESKVEEPLAKSVGHFVIELNKLFAFYLTTAHLSVCSKGPNIHFHTRTFMWALVAALFTVALCQLLGVNQGALQEDYRRIHYAASRQWNITMY